MRDLDGRMAEITRRSQARIKQIKKRRIGVLMTCVPVVLCVALVMGSGAQNKDNAAHAPEAALKQESEVQLSESNQGNAELADSNRAPVSGGTVLLEQVQYIRTDGYADGAKFPRVAVIESKDALDSYYHSNKDTFDLERRQMVYSDSTIGFMDACHRYDERFFENSYLVLVLLEEGSGSVRHKVAGIEKTDDAVLVKIQRIVPEMGTDDMAQWHIILEVKRTGKPVTEEQVLVEFQ